MTWEEEFDEKFHGNGDFPKRISDPILCDEIKDFIQKTREEAVREAQNTPLTYQQCEHLKNTIGKEWVREALEMVKDEVRKMKLTGDCENENCIHDACGTIRWYNKAFIQFFSIINKHKYL